MNTTDTGGPAFPLYIPAQHAGDNSEVIEGMTRRDYFAAKAMQSYLVGDDRDSFTFDEWAIASYQMADAMLKARKA